jgi:hypothetical protein
MALSNKTEIERVVHSYGKHVSKEFYAWFEKKCQRLLETAIQGSSTGKVVRMKTTEALMRACGKGI